MTFKNSKVPFLKKDILEEVASLDFPSIAAAGAATLTVTVKGAEVGDAVMAHATSAPTSGLIFSAYVSAADTVTVRANNVTAGAVDAAAVDFVVLVVKAD